MSHAFVGILTCAHIHSIELDRASFVLLSAFASPTPTCFKNPACAREHKIADEGGATSMSGGIAWLTLPAGYLGSGLIGAALIACGFDTNASKVASLVLAVFFVFTLWWARRNLLCVRPVLRVVCIFFWFWRLTVWVLRC
jgi:hypothetical protein